MTEVLEQALGSGQKQQADALMGHMSIFDLGDDGDGDGDGARGVAGRIRRCRRASGTRPSCCSARRRRSACT